MSEPTVRPSPLRWWAGGLLLGVTMVLAVAVRKPLGVSTQFVVVEGWTLHKYAPQYAEGHELIGPEADAKARYRSFGYGWWLAIGLVAGALAAAVFSGRWRPRVNTAWALANGIGPVKRLALGFVGGILILLGARLAHGCTSGQFASGWAQLSLSAIPFTVTMFGFGLLAARLVYPKSPRIEKEV